MPDRTVFKSFIVDTNCVNARQRIEAMNHLETWAAVDIISLLTAEAAQREMIAGGDRIRSEKAYQFIFTMSEISTDGERSILGQIGRILFPAGIRTANERNDVDIVFNAGKYVRPLITNDGGSKTQPGGILGNREKLASLGIVVLSPEEAAADVRKAIDFRDKEAIRMSNRTGQPVPGWVGKD